MTAMESVRCPHAKRFFNSNGEVIQVACDQWLCVHCSKILAWRWSQRVSYGIALRLDKEPWFWTITLPAWVPDSATGYKILPGRWDRLRKELQRANPHFCYAAFVEAHPHRNLIPHFHIITFEPSPRRFKDLVVHAGFGHQAKELEINGRVAINYVSKYVSKGENSIPRHFRRVRISQAWPQLPTPVYEHTLYPIERGETLPRYFQRVSVLVQHPVDALRDRYLDHSRDVV